MKIHDTNTALKQLILDNLAQADQPMDCHELYAIAATMKKPHGCGFWAFGRYGC